MKKTKSEEEGKAPYVSQFPLPRKPIPEHILSLIEKEWGLGKLKNLTSGQLEQKALGINEKIKSLYKENFEKFKFYFRPLDPENENASFISYKTLQRYLDGESAQSNQLYALLLSIDIPVEKIKELVGREPILLDQSYINLLEGSYRLFVMDPTDNLHVKCAPLWLTRQKDFFEATYKNIWGTFFNGRATINDNILIFDLKDKKGSKIFLSFELIKEINITYKNLILNGAALSCLKQSPVVATNVILVKTQNLRDLKKDDYTVKQDILYLEYDKKPRPVILENNKLFKTDGVNIEIDELTQADLNEIVVYLTRKSKETTIHPFKPNVFGQIKKRNQLFEKKANRENYQKLKLLLSRKDDDHKFYAFNRFKMDAEVAVFYYIFKFYDEQRICWATRYRLSQPNVIDVHGEVTLENEKIYMILKDDTTQRRKFVIAPYTTKSDKFILRCLSTTVSSISHNPMSLREIIVDIPNLIFFNKDEYESDFISHEKFCSLTTEINNTLNNDDSQEGKKIEQEAKINERNKLDFEDKLYLSDFKQSVLTYPSQTNVFNFYSRQDKARRFANEYIIFIKNKYKEGLDLLKIVLKIDRLSQVTMNVKYSDVDKIFTYQGNADFFAPNLRLELRWFSEDISEMKNAIFIFDYIKNSRKPQPFYTGMCIDTDDDNMSCAYTFIAIPFNLIKEKNVNFLLKPDDISFDDFKTLVKSIPGTSEIDNTFFDNLLTKRL